MSAVDHLLQRLRQVREDGGRHRSSDVSARFLVTKLSWRGSYRRLLCITPTHIATLYPDTLVVTNSWAFTGDHDLAGVEVGGEHADGGLFTLHFRRDKKGLSSKDVKFACKERAALLSLLYRGIELAVTRGSCGLGPTVVGQPEEFWGHKLRKGCWQPVLLRVTSHTVERLDPGSGMVKWRLEYRHMASPAARLLVPGEGQPAGQGAFALFGKTGRSPRVYCCGGRDSFLIAIQTAALRKLGLTLAVDSNTALDGVQLLAAVAAAERERAATVADAPLGEWEVMRVRDLPDGSDLAVSRAAADISGWSGVAHRRLVLTRGGLLERRSGDYEVAEWRQLPAVAALVRFAEDPQWLAVEWADGTPATAYVTPARDALLAAVLDAAQSMAGRAIPVLSQPTAPGDVIVAQRAQAVAAPAVTADVELDKLCLYQLSTAARDFMATSGPAVSLAALALAGLTAGAVASSAAAAAGSDTVAAEEASIEAVGTSSLQGGSLSSLPGPSAASGRSGFMHRAFARQPVGNSCSDSSSGIAGWHGDGDNVGSATEAFAAFQQRMREFNACVPYAGLQPGCRVEDVVILTCLAHLPRQQPSAHGLGRDEARVAVAALQCLQRLAGASVAVPQKAGSGVVGMSQIIGAAGGAGRIFAALMSGHDHVAAEAARLLLRFFAPAAASQGVGPWAGATSGEALDSIEEESVAMHAHASKSVCFISHSRCATLVHVLRQARTAPLLSMAVAEATAAVICEPGSRTTEQSTLQTIVQETATLGRPLFSLFSHPAPRVSHAAALIMRAVAEGGTETAQPMREAALTEGAVLTHLLNALSPRGGGAEAAAALSRDLVAVWADEYAPALGLLKRIFPAGLMRFLNQRRQQMQNKVAVAAAAAPPVAAPRAGRAGEAGQPTAAGAVPAGTATEAAVPLTQQQQQQQQQPPIGQAAAPAMTQQPAAAAEGDPLHPAQAQLQRQEAQRQQRQQQRRRWQRGSPIEQRYLEPQPPPRPGTLKGNWDALWAAVQRDHNHAALIWNDHTRAELREALQAEEAALHLARLRGADAAPSAASGVGSGAAGNGSGGGGLCWNHAEFRVTYPSLSKHLCIAGIYVRLLLEPGAGSSGGIVERLPAPRDFFSAAHHRLMCLGDASLLPSVEAAAAARLGGSGSSGGRVVDAEADRELCVRAMAAAYHAHAGAIGPVDGILHLAALLDATPSRALRQQLLRLFEALVSPSVLATASSGDSSGGVAAARAAHANGVALLEAKGVQLMVDLLAAAHEASERPVAALQTNLIAGSSYTEDSWEWYYYPLASAVPPPASGDQQQQKPQQQEGQRVGPVSKAKIRQLYSSGAVSDSTPFWTAGMAEPLPLGVVRELRWWVAHRIGPLTALQAAGVALRVLQALADQQPAVDRHSGKVLFPLPLAHRQMTSLVCLPHIAQVLLTGEPALVAGAATLLLTVLQHNADGLASLYRTGLHFFALAYCGSSLREVACLLKACHLAASNAACSDASGLSLAQRSILGGLLPESLLHMLESYGADQFAAALVGDSDSPELIWTHRMRAQRLVPQMLCHLGDFPQCLRESCHTVYEYTPCPPVGYPEIEGEVWCHRYYLRHMCDEARHPSWPLVDHVQLLQSLLDAWRVERARQPLAMSETDACTMLGLQLQPSGIVPEEELKAAYRRLARLYHPDKNPAGRDRFMGVQAAYERLQAGVTGGQGPQLWRIRLILRAQCVLFRRYPEVLEPFKYAGYPLLLQAIALPPAESEGDRSASGEAVAEHFLSPEAASQLQAATELCWLTCACSRLNGEELTRAGGLRLLGDLLMRCIAVVPADVAPQQPVAVIATHALRALAVMASFENARAQLELEQSQKLVSDIVRCCGLERAPAAVEAALLCLARCCASSQLQGLLLERGMLGYVMPLLLSYDATHTDADGSNTQLLLQQPQQRLPDVDDAAAVLRLPLLRVNAQATKNLHAQLAVRALAALAAYPPSPAKSSADDSKVQNSRPAAAAQPLPPPATPPCAAAQRALSALLTETLAPRLVAADPLPLLRDLNTSVQTPQVIWNSSMRQELLELLEQQRITAASAAAAAEPAAAAATARAASGFSYQCLCGELAVAGVFVRIYTEQPDFQLSDPPAFCKALVTYIYQQQQEWEQQQQGSEQAWTEKGEAAQQARQLHLLQALRALRLVLECTPRLLGLLATKTAVNPLLECLRPACTAGLPGGATWAATTAASSSEPAACLAASPPVWAAPQGVVANGVSAADLEVAELALVVLLQLTAHAGCIDALSQDKCITRAYWLAHRAPNTALLMLALRLLHALAGTTACAWGAAAHGGTLYLLTLLLPAYQVPEEEREAFEAVRVAAASLLARLSAHALHGTRITLALSKLLPPGLVSAIQDGPGEAAVVALGQASETPERVWNRSMRAAASEEIAHLAAAARAQQAASTLEWQLPDGFRMQYQELAGELLVGGVYVRLYLKDPRYPLRNPMAFLEGLLERYVSVVQHSTPGAQISSPSKPSSALALEKPPTAAADLPLLLSAAAVALLQVQAPLAEHAVALGYVEKMVRLLAARAPELPGGTITPELLEGAPLMPDELSGSLLRLLHQLVSSGPAAEALARCTPPVVPPLLGAMHWGTGAAVLALETLKRSLVPANRWRDNLVNGCLSAGLVPLLLQRLDWRQKTREGQEERDASVQRVLFVDVLNLLALVQREGGGAPGERVRALLDASDVWGAYRGQRHDLFLPAGSSHASGVAGLLQGPEAARYALPPALTTLPAAAAESTVSPRAGPPAVPAAQPTMAAALPSQPHPAAPAPAAAASAAPQAGTTALPPLVAVQPAPLAAQQQPPAPPVPSPQQPLQPAGPAIQKQPIDPLSAGADVPQEQPLVQRTPPHAPAALRVVPAMPALAALVVAPAAPAPVPAPAQEVPTQPPPAQQAPATPHSPLALPSLQSTAAITDPLSPPRSSTTEVYSSPLQGRSIDGSFGPLGDQAGSSSLGGTSISGATQRRVSSGGSGGGDPEAAFGRRSSHISSNNGPLGPLG